MRKNILFVFALCTMVFAVQAQDEPGDVTTKNGVGILPSTGDFAIGINASPFLEYMGNVFTGGFNSAPDFGFTAQHPGEIYLKYYYTNSTVLRAALGIGITKEVEKFNQANLDDDPDKAIYSAMDVGITLGMEKRKYTGSRLVGFYGAQVMIRKTPYNDGTGLGTYKYVDAETPDNNFKETGGNAIALGAGAFIGAEYFIFPKVSLSGEFGLNLGTSVTGIRKRVNNDGDESLIDEGSSVTGLGTNASGDLKLLFYF